MFDFYYRGGVSRILRDNSTHYFAAEFVLFSHLLNLFLPPLAPYLSIIGVTSAHGPPPLQTACSMQVFNISSHQRTLTIGVSISVWLSSCLTSLELTKHVKLMLIQPKQNS